MEMQDQQMSNRTPWVWKLRLARIRDARGGKLNDSDFGTRMCGTGEIAQQIGDMFRLFAKRYGLDGKLPAYDCTLFRPPGQMWLF